MSRIQGKVTVITGASRGIGKSIAERLAEEGARLAITDIDGDALAKTAAAVRERGADVVATAGDIVDPATIEGLVEQAVSRFSRIDALVNNVGMILLKSLEETTIADFDRLMHVNCLSHLLAMQRVVPHMRRAGGGSIVNVSSVGGLLALPNASVYCPSKSAVIGLTRAAAAEFAPHIRCNAICPGGVNTPMAQAHLASFADKDAAMAKLTGRQLIKRYAEPREIANVALFLVSDESSFMTGAILPVEAGHTAW